jgi:hypothetical protein
MSGEVNYLTGVRGTARLFLSMLAGLGLLGAILWSVAVARGGVFFVNVLKSLKRRQGVSTEIEITVSFAFLFSLSSLVGYTVLGKDVFGFPIYHFPAVCTSALLVGWFLRQNEILRAMLRSPVVGLAVVIVVAFVFFIQGDVAWTCLTLPRLFILGESRNIAWIVLQVLRILLAAGGAASLFWLLSMRVRIGAPRKWDRIICALTLAFAVCSVAQDLRQAAAPYSTLYGYGERETQEAAAGVAEGLQSGDRILAPWYFVYNAYLTEGGKWTYPRHDWTTRQSDRLVSELERPETRFFAVSIWSLPIARRNDLFGAEEVRELLNTGFEKKQIGTWTIWEKRDFIDPDRNNL